MTTVTPISSVVRSSGEPGGPAQGLEAGPGGLPDESLLTRLANEFFRMLPGSVIEPRLGDPAVAQAPPAFTDTVTSAAPRLAPSPPLADTPGTLIDDAPARMARAGGVGVEIPEAYAAALPRVAPASALLSTSPYYFLEFFGEAPTNASQVAGVAAPPSVDDRVAAQPFNLPGAGALRDLLAGSDIDHAQAGQTPAKVLAHNPHPGFYFIEPAGAAIGQTPAVPQSAHPPFDVHAVRRDFPILAERVHGRQLVWFDNAATTQKPQAVIDRLTWFYTHENSNIHRAAHELAARATDAFEAARKKVARFLGASSPDEIIFVRGTTEAINLVAQSYGRQYIGPGDEIVVSLLEHHANIVPWQQVAAEKGAKLRVIPVDDNGQLLLDEYRKLLTDRTKLVAITQVSNALGTIVPVREIVDLAHRAGAHALVDGAQSVAHMRTNVQALDADFFVFSGHKIFGPTGIGVVYGKSELLDRMPPWQGGGNMIADVTFERTLYQKPPTRFEAGTANIADAVGLGTALDYLEGVGIENVARYEHDLLAYAMHLMQAVPGLRLIGTAREKASVLSFTLQGYETHEVGKALNEEGIAVRAGHHCAQPILRRFGVETTVRPSIAFYNTCEEVDRMVAVLGKLAQARAKTHI